MRKSKCLWLTLLACLFAAGCDSDSAVLTDEEDTKCEGGACDDTQIRDEFECTVSCKLNEQKCSNNDVMICKNGDKNCKEWVLDEKCESGTHCDETDFRCVKGCKEKCDSENNKRCSKAGVEICEDDEFGCALWTLSEDCKGTVCDETEFKCVRQCENSCTQAEKRCTDNAVEECKDTDGDGCNEWTEAEKCIAGFACDDETKSCKCKSECKEGEKKCDGADILTCTGNENGCLAWKRESCDTAKICIESTKTCDWACGDDCDKFSIILIPDTQNYSKVPQSKVSLADSIYTKQMQWIKDNKTNNNIRAAIHLGDITDNNSEGHWEVATYAQQFLDQADIPYTIAPGNHDYTCSGYTRGKTKVWNYFGPDHFKGKSWFHASPFTGNTYAFFNIGNIKFMILALEFAARKDVICWADDLLKQYPDHHVIVETHNYLTANSSAKEREDWYSGGAYWPAPHGASGWDLFYELVAKHSNVFLVVSGHVGDSEMRQKKGYGGNTVTEMLVDYQFDAPCTQSKPENCTDHCKHVENAGNGWLRELVFDPKMNNVQAKTFTVLPNNKFAGNKPAFYCSSYNNDAGNRRYSADVNAADHQFSFVSDFTTPIKYEYNQNFKDGADKEPFIGFVTRDINSIGDGEQTAPDIAMNRKTGSFVAVWEDDSNSLDGTASAGYRKGQPNHDIMGRIFYGGGCQKVAQFLISDATINKDGVSSTNGDQVDPKAAMDVKGNFVVVWADDQDGNGAYEIMMKGFDENGKERFKSTLVNTNSANDQLYPAIAMASDGRFVVAWQDESEKAGQPQVFIRGFSADGQEAFPARSVAAFRGIRTNPDVAMADDGSFVVTWQDKYNADLNEIVAKGFTAKGEDRIDMHYINSEHAAEQRNPSITMRPNGSYYIAYEDDADNNGYFRIKARGYNKDGKQIMDDIWISDPGENAVDPVICADDDNKVIFGWTALALHKGDIRRRDYVDNKLQEKTKTIHPFITDNIQDKPALACTATGKHAFVYRDDMDGNGYHELLGRGFDIIDDGWF